MISIRNKFERIEVQHIKNQDLPMVKKLDNNLKVLILEKLQ